MATITLRDIQVNDIDDYFYWNHPSREFHKWNGPYFKKETLSELKKRIKKIKKNILDWNENLFKEKKLIVDKISDELIGEVNWYWKSEETAWMEIGIVIFNEKYWRKGIGTIALTLWINEIFQAYPELIRIGLSTWSGNKWMIHLAEKIWLKKEAVYRKARIVDGIYYDSISYGILREEWR